MKSVTPMRYFLWITTPQVFGILVPVIAIQCVMATIAQYTIASNAAVLSVEIGPG